ncbi:MAG: energy transducer TonB [Pseudomonadota bacterium]
MKRLAEFLLFAGVAVAIHLVLMLVLHTDAPLAAGGPVSSGNPITTAGDLSELIDSWEELPDTAEAQTLESTDIVDDPAVQPEEMTETETFDVSALVQPQLLVTRPQTLMQPQVTTPTPPTSAVPTPQALTDPQPVTADTRVDLPELNLLQTPTAEPLPLPMQAEIKPREDESEPDPNRPVKPLDRLELTQPEAQPDLSLRPEPELAMNIQPQSPQRVALPQPTAPTIPRPEPEPVAEDTEAPLFAALPKAKPTPPKAQKPQQTTTRKKPARKKPAQKKTAHKKPTQAKLVGNGGTATNTTQQTQGGDGTRTAALTPGAGGVAKDGGFSKAAITSARKAFLTAVRRAVERRKKYPKRAQRRGIEGRAIIRVTLDASGRLVSASMAGSSGQSMLDEAAMAAVKRVGRYPAIPKEMGKSRVSIKLPITFRKR